MTYATSTPRNAPRKYNTIKMDVPDYFLAILSHYSSKFDDSCLMCLHSFFHLQCRISHTRARRPAHRSQSSIPQILDMSFFRGNKKNTAPPSLSRGGGGGRATAPRREQAPAALPSSPPRGRLPLSLRRLRGQAASRCLRPGPSHACLARRSRRPGSALGAGRVAAGRAN